MLYSFVDSILKVSVALACIFYLLFGGFAAAVSFTAVISWNPLYMQMIIPISNYSFSFFGFILKISLFILPLERSYQNMLQKFLLPQLKSRKMPIQATWFQQDG